MNRAIALWTGGLSSSQALPGPVFTTSRALSPPRLTSASRALRAFFLDAATLARLRDLTRGPTSPPTTW